MTPGPGRIWDLTILDRGQREIFTESTPRPIESISYDVRLSLPLYNFLAERWKLLAKEVNPLIIQQRTDKTKVIILFFWTISMPQSLNQSIGFFIGKILSDATQPHHQTFFIAAEAA